MSCGTRSTATAPAPTSPSAGCSNATRANCGTSASTSRPSRTRAGGRTIRRPPATGSARNPTGCRTSSLTPAECTVLILAAQLWEHAALGSAAVNAVRKLQASGGLVDAELPAGVQPRIRPAGQAFEDLVTAMHAQHPVSFRYLAGSTGKEEERLVEPWGLGSRFGQWYLVAHDRTRGDKRFFRALPPHLRRDRAGEGKLHPAGGLQRARRTGRPGGAAGQDRRPRRRRRAGCAGSVTGPSALPVPEPGARTAHGRPRPPQRAIPGRRDPGRGTRLLRARGSASCPRPSCVTSVRRRLAAAARFASAPVPPVDFPAVSSAAVSPQAGTPARP